MMQNSAVQQHAISAHLDTEVHSNQLVAYGIVGTKQGNMRAVQVAVNGCTNRLGAPRWSVLYRLPLSSGRHAAVVQVSQS